jgi:hypothetical protein
MHILWAETCSKTCGWCIYMKETFHTVYVRLPNTITDVLIKKRYLVKFSNDDNLYSTPVGEDVIEELLKQIK